MKITHYYAKDCMPLKSVTALPPQMQKVMGEKFSNNMNHAFKRFENIDYYLKRRHTTEKWLYKAFKSIGGIPKTHCPIYGVLGESNYLKSCFGNNSLSLEFDISNIPDSEISFTLGDSIQLYFSTNIKVYTKSMILEWLVSNNLNLNSICQQLDKDHTYIEAQLWNPQSIITNYHLFISLIQLKYVIYILPLFIHIINLFSLKVLNLFYSVILIFNVLWFELIQKTHISNVFDNICY